MGDTAEGTLHLMMNMSFSPNGGVAPTAYGAFFLPDDLSLAPYPCRVILSVLEIQQPSVDDLESQGCSLRLAAFERE